MAASLQGVKKGSLVHTFITAGKPGPCELCGVYVLKLEAHHICYSPEITIKICHNCHHKTHFWPNRLTTPQKLKLLSKRYGNPVAQKLLSENELGVSALAKVIAPSRQKFIHEAQRKESARILSPHRKVNKGVDLSFLKRIHGRKSK